MPGKKRKADSSSSMWGSSSNSSSPSSSRRSSNKQSSSSRRGGGGGGAQGSGAYPYINEEGASKLFEEICEEDDPNVAGMEGELVLIIFYNYILDRIAASTVSTVPFLLNHL